MPNSSLSGLVVSTLISTFLYAVTCCQIYVYYKSNFKDPARTRGLVMLVVLFETAHTFCFWIYLYRVTVLNYGDLSILTKRDWSLSLSVVFHGIISALVQAYYAYRIWVLSRWHYISIISWGGSVLEILGSIGITTALQKFGPIEFTAHWKWIAIATIGLDVFIDTVNTVALSLFLYTHRTGFKQTDQLIVRLIAWTIETGLLTSVVATVMLIACIALPNSELYIALSAFYPKLYSNSLFASLNGRGPLGPGASKHKTTTFDERHHTTLHEFYITQETIEMASSGDPHTGSSKPNPTGPFT